MIMVAMAAIAEVIQMATPCVVPWWWYHVCVPSICHVNLFACCDCSDACYIFLVQHLSALSICCRKLAALINRMLYLVSVIGSAQFNLVW